MSNNSFNYMDGVPVKISERYKPPPKVSIPQGIVNRLNTSENYLESSIFNYDFTLENRVITKIDEWKRVRELERENRRKRLRKYEVDRAKQLEEKQKELLTAVSYPSADDLSSGGEEDEDVSNQQAACGLAHQQHESAQFRPLQKYFDTILTPTVLPTDLTLPPPPFSYSAKYNSKINYSDFENDTSSPFDNIELKTINDLDILAQVLNVTQLHSNKVTEDSTTSERDNLQNNIEKNSKNNEFNNCTDNMNVNNYSTIAVSTSVAECSTIQNNFYTFDKNPQAQVLQNYVNMNGSPRNNEFYYNYNNLPTSNQNFLYNNSYPLECKLDYNPNSYQNAYNQIRYGNDEATHTDAASLKNKSKSVPDIVKELNDEIRDSEIRRARNHSQTLEDHQKKLVEQQASQSSPTRKSQSNIPESFKKLSKSSQKLVKNISLMGFPLERVSKIAEKLGNDDKKIVEHLIPLSELLDLGFDESKISEALLKFNNNKEKALDFLIS